MDAARSRRCSSSNGPIPEGSTLASDSPIDRAETFTASDFDLVRGKNDPLSDLTFNGNLNFDLGVVNLRLGGGYATRPPKFTFSNSLYNRDSFYNDERDSYRLYGTLRQRVSNTTFYQIQGEFQDFQYVQLPGGLLVRHRGRPALRRRRRPENAVARRYYVYRDATSDGVDNPTTSRSSPRTAAAGPSGSSRARSACRAASPRRTSRSSTTSATGSRATPRRSSA